MRLDCYHLYRLWDLLITVIMAFIAIEVPTHFVLEYNISLTWWSTGSSRSCCALTCSYSGTALPHGWWALRSPVSGRRLPPV